MSDAELKKALSSIRDIRAALGDSAVLSGDSVHARQTSFWDPSPVEAQAIVRPRTTEEVSAVLRICNQHGQPIVVQGGRTGCAQGANARPAEIVLSLELMNKIEAIDPVGRTAVVQAGCALQTLQEAVDANDLYLPLDLGARGSCTVGGNVATNAGGINVLRFGMAREQILGLEVVLTDGTIISSLNTLIKNNSGPDIKQIFIGSEGLFGVVTRVVFRLRERLPYRATAMVALDGFECVWRLLKHVESRLGGALSCFEMMYGDYYDFVSGDGGHPRVINGGAPFYVILEAQAASDAIDAIFESVVAEAFESELVIDGAIAKTASEQNAIWRIREDFEPILREREYFLYDIGLPIDRMERYIAALRSVLEKRFEDVRFFVLGHIADSNLHLFVGLGAKETARRVEIDSLVYEPLRALGGTISAEHGIGFEKKAHLDVSRSDAEIALMQRLKSLFDPNNILNPGRVVDL